MQISRSALVPLLLAVALIAGIAGCGNEHRTYQVNGTVEFEDGFPVMFGEIEFQCEAHPVNARGKISRDGTFSLTTYKNGDGAIAGQHKVVITQMLAPTPVGVEVIHDHGSMVSKRYYSFKTSDLIATVDQSETTIKLIVDKEPE